jgi:hypothetical protein
MYPGRATLWPHPGKNWGARPLLNFVARACRRILQKFFLREENRKTFPKKRSRPPRDTVASAASECIPFKTHLLLSVPQKESSASQAAVKVNSVWSAHKIPYQVKELQRGAVGELRRRHREVVIGHRARGAVFPPALSLFLFLFV